MADDSPLVNISICSLYSGAPFWGHTPTTLSGPMSLMKLSDTLPLELPWASVSMLPRSPTWRFSSPGAPCVLPWGLTAEELSFCAHLGMDGTRQGLLGHIQ